MRLSPSFALIIPALVALSAVISVASAIVYEISNAKSSHVLVVAIPTPVGAPVPAATTSTPTTIITTSDPPVFLTEDASQYPNLARWDVSPRNGSDVTSALVIKNISLVRWVYYPVYGPTTTSVASATNAADFDIDVFAGELAFVRHRKSGLYLTEIEKQLRLQAAANTPSQVWRLRRVE